MNNTEIQQRAINKLNRLKVGALFMALGTGKTKVALDLMAAKSCKCDYFLWICPCGLKNEIQNERAKWRPNLDIAPNTLYKKMQGTVQEFTQTEIRKIAERYNLTAEEIKDIFF